MKIIKPTAIRDHEKVAVIAPACLPVDPKITNNLVKIISLLGFNAKIYPSAKESSRYKGYLGGSKELRAQDINDAFADQEIKAIFCVRGGYGGCLETLPLLNYELIKKNPKILVGFSDVTSLQIALLEKCNLVTFHGPMLSSNFAKENIEFTKNNLLKMITSKIAVGELPMATKQAIKVINSGVARGKLFGGNLVTLLSTIGNRVFNDNVVSFKEKILFVEEVGEEPKRMRRYFEQLCGTGKLSELAGIVIGQLHGCEYDPTDPESESLEDLIKEKFGNLGIPVIYGFPFGHVPEIWTLPQGILAELNTETKSLKILEAAVV